MEEEHRRTLVNYPKTTEIPDLTTESKPRDIENCLKDLNESFIVFLLIPTIVIIIFGNNIICVRLRGKLGIFSKQWHITFINNNKLE